MDKPINVIKIRGFVRHYHSGNHTPYRGLLHDKTTDRRIDYRMERLHWPDVKPAAHLIIDDRAFCFSGRFPSVNEIVEFEPWWKGGQDRVAYLEERLHKADGMANEVNILVKENRALRQQRDELLALLKDLEWIGDENSYRCPRCGGVGNHELDCQLDAAIAKVEGNDARHP